MITSSSTDALKESVTSGILETLAYFTR